MITINMKEWLGVNERTRVSPTDKWYLDFANKVLPLVQESPLFDDEDRRTQIEAAIALSQYFQDAVSQTGGWKLITDMHFNLYGTYLPFYTLTDEYVPDEINIEDIALVLWTQKAHYAVWCKDEYTLFDPYDEELMALSRAAYDLMDSLFEEAPISEVPTTDIWVMGPDLLEMPRTPLPEITPETELKEDVKLFLEYSKGKSLLYFSDYPELCAFFVDVLKWDNQPSSLLPELRGKKEFVVYANAKGILVAHGVAAYFCEAHNPMYNAQRAAKEGYKMFCRPELCPFDLAKYGMIKGILPDVALPFPSGKELLHKYWDFIARYYLYDYYEGF